MLKVYAYAHCDSCRRALKWLDAHHVAHEVKAIRETPPTLGELRAALEVHKGDLRRLFNTSGQDYRALDLKARLPGLKPDEALKLLAGNGNLVKRPFVTGPGVALNGFDEARWAEVLL